MFFFIESKFLVLVLGMLFCLGILISFCILWVWGLFLKEFVFDGGVDLLCSFMGFEFVIFIVNLSFVKLYNGFVFLLRINFFKNKFCVCGV